MSIIPPAHRASNSTPIYLPGRPKPIGYVSGGVFVKTIKGSKHILNHPRSIGFDTCTLADAEKAGATEVSLHDVETGKTYTASIADVLRYGVNVVRGHGQQIALPIDRYSVDGAQPEAERRAAATNKERVDLQLGLFGGAA